MLELHMLESRLKDIEEDYMLIKAKCKLINIQDKGKWRYAKECLSHIGVWGINMRVFTEQIAIKKGDPSWEDPDIHHQSQVDYAQGKCMILTGFYFTGLAV